MNPRQGKLKPRYIVGLVLIALAVGVFFNNVGFPFIGMIASQWPAALIILGGILLFSPGRQKSSQGSRDWLPYILIGIGIVILLIKFHAFHFSFGAVIVPLLLMLFGVHVLRSGSRARNRLNRSDINSDQDTTPDSEADLGRKDRIDVFTLLGSGDFNTRSQNLSDGTVISILGGAQIDIREADTRAGQIEIDILSFMGGVVLKIPPHWQVTCNVLPLLGGVSNKTTCLAEKLNIPKRQLLVTGVSIMGGIDIRN